MPNERENFNGALKIVEYDISGDYMRAYYDADGKLVCVLDFATSDTKPNVLLVTNPVGNRKWDDILVNDYNVDLESVRPKKDNKYQKLDIEYTGLGVYDNLFRAYDDDKDVAGALKQLEIFRNDASRRAAFERLGAAEITAGNARETIEKTKQTVAEQQEKLKDLRSKLTAQRKKVGKEPTKQSASKILKTEAQIDAINEKMARSKKRLVSAQRRLVAAEEDADVARDILETLDDFVAMNDGTDYELPAMPATTDVAVVNDPSVPMTSSPQFTDLTIQTKADDMADEEVKPLFDEEPEILDENIAFKPIDFGATSGDEVKPAPVAHDDIDIETKDAVHPLSFAPPVRSSDGVPVEDTAPVLNSLTSVPPQQSEQIDSELMATIDIPGFTDIPDVPSETSVVTKTEAPVYSEPVSPVVPVPEYTEPTVQEIVEESAPTPMPEIETAPTVPDARPVSPITGAVSAVGATHRKPTKLYYLLLVVLIILSVFTLWVYQKSTPDVNVPALDAKVEAVEEVPSTVVAEEEQKEDVGAEKEATDDETSPFIVDEEVEEKSDVETVDIVADGEEVLETTEQPQVEQPSSESVAVQEDVDEVVDINAAVFPDVEPVAVPVVTEAPEEVVVNDEVEDTPDSPFLSDEVVAPAETKSVAEIIASKPVYNVSQQDKMFVADEEYETDAVDTVEEAVVVDAPVVDYSEPVVVGATDADDVEQEVCSDGNAPDTNGCCAGETFVDGLCCADGTDECFPPM